MKLNELGRLQEYDYKFDRNPQFISHIWSVELLII